MLLELAENNSQGYYSMMAQAGDKDPSGLYMYIPAQVSASGEGMYVREDSFDMLPDHQWDQLQDVLEPYQEKNLSLFGLGKKARAARKKRKADRQLRKKERFDARTGRRMELATIRGERGGGALGIIGDTVSNIFGGGAAPPEAYPTELPPAKPTLMGMPMWMPIIIGGGLLVTVLVMGRGKRKRK